MLSHSARLSPLQPPTEWRLQDGVLIETRGRRVRRLPLSALRRLEMTAHPRRAARLLFAPFSAVVIPADSFVSPLRHESGAATFEPLVAALMTEGAMASPRARLASAAPGPAAAVLTVAAILAFVALGFGGLSLALGAAAIGLDFGARMLFAAILLLAVRPWLVRRDGG